ncbi:MAG: hypothetical protein ABWY20_08330 [Mycobacterium sp.]
MKITINIRSDQWNAEDFLDSPRIFTIAGIREGKAEAPYDIDLVEGEGKCWRPPLTVLKLLKFVWETDEAEDWVGRRVQLYRDPEVSFGRDKTGGIRVSAVSHIDSPKSVNLTSTRGKRAKHTVTPLPVVAAPTPEVSPDLIDQWTTAFSDAADIAALQDLWKQAGAQGVAKNAEILAAKDKRKGELT